jgi:hypothetical protein
MASSSPASPLLLLPPARTRTPSRSRGSPPLLAAQPSSRTSSCEGRARGGLASPTETRLGRCVPQPPQQDKGPPPLPRPFFAPCARLGPARPAVFCGDPTISTWDRHGGRQRGLRRSASMRSGPKWPHVTPTFWVRESRGNMRPLWPTANGRRPSQAPLPPAMPIPCRNSGIPAKIGGTGGAESRARGEKRAGTGGGP